MLNWLKNLASRRQLTQEELEDMEDSDPMLFTPKQRAFLKDLFPKAWTHMDNLDQELLMKVAAALTCFGYQVDSYPKMVRALAMLVTQDIIETPYHSTYLIRRA